MSTVGWFITFMELGGAVWNTTGGCRSRHTLPLLSLAGFTGGLPSTQSIPCLTCPACCSLVLDLGLGHGQCPTRLHHCVPDTQVQSALGRLKCRQHLVDIHLGADSTMRLARDEPSTQVRTALDSLKCGQHLAGIGVDYTGHLAA